MEFGFDMLLVRLLKMLFQKINIFVLLDEAYIKCSKILFKVVYACRCSSDKLDSLVFRHIKSSLVN